MQPWRMHLERKLFFWLTAQLRFVHGVLQEVMALRRAMKRFGRAKLAEDCSAELQGDTWMLSGSC